MLHEEIPKGDNTFIHMSYKEFQEKKKRKNFDIDKEEDKTSLPINTHEKRIRKLEFLNMTN